MAGKLVVLLAQYEPPPIPVHLVLPSTHAKTAKQRAFVAFAAPRLRRCLIKAASEIGGSGSASR
jgi:DNA-binding transcriptional LysR family regulator